MQAVRWRTRYTVDRSIVCTSEEAKTTTVVAIPTSVNDTDARYCRTSLSIAHTPSSPSQPATVSRDLATLLMNKHDLVLFCFVGCLTSQQHASVFQGRICSDKFTCCHTEIQVEDQTFHLTQPQYTDTGPTSPSADPITPGAWQGSHWSANV